MINVGVNILNNPKGAGVGTPRSPEGGPPTHNRDRRKDPGRPTNVRTAFINRFETLNNVV